MSVTLIVAALGYFVDVYDLILFGIVRVQSLKSLGYQGSQLLDYGVMLLDIQMAGMLLGGILWGVLGDKKGRVRILFASIMLYSIANFANGFIQSIEGYALCRFIAGVGLAGELGVGVTLVLEILPKDLRGYGTMIVATVGVSGSVIANLTTKFFDWRASFIIGGVLGMVLLVLQFSVLESGIFSQIASKNVSRGNFFSFFTNFKRFSRYIKSVLIGAPIWFSLSILITFSPEFAKALKINGTINAGDAIMYYYLGATFGDFISGFLSQYIKSRKKVVFYFITGLTIMIFVYLIQYDISSSTFYIICALTGLPAGYWAVFITISAEQFGTNLRATAASTIPNFVRGLVIPFTLLFQFFAGFTGVRISGAIVAGVCLVFAFFSLNGLEETYHKDLNYLEE
ncbi:MAG: major facilitator superfamily 1 [Ignavibacteria bacterium]|nr:major facilitator superfamily 1 [Ignavibacteria bacterium]